MPFLRPIALCALLALAAGMACSMVSDSSRQQPGEASGSARRSGEETNSPLERACALPARHVRRINRGYVPRRSEEIHLVPRLPAYSGLTTTVNHSGPWDHLQQVPLVLYGPHRIAASGVVARDVTLADVYPTVGRLTRTDLEPRSGTVLSEAVKSGTAGRPRMIVTIVWDGVGRNVLRHWRGRWPTLARLEREGTSYLNATVGSSPSITPATHATLGTGVFPREHTVAGIHLRTGNGLKEAFKGADPSDLPLTTYADQVDAAFDNDSKVGIVGWGDWHLPMMGHGRALPDGDADHLAFILHGGEVSGNPKHFSTPAYLNEYPGLQTRAAELDRADGLADGKWLGLDILADMRTPAWVHYATDMLLGLLEREAYGADDVTDLMFVNYKMTDYVGHQNQYESEEMAAVLKAQDLALNRLIDHLDSSVRDYVVVLTSDHGHTPSPRRTGGWAIREEELKADINAHFDVPANRSLVERITAVGIFVDQEMLTAAGVTLDDLARFVNGYTIGDNNPERTMPKAFKPQATTKLFAAAWPPRRMAEVMRCKFGSKN